MHDKKIEQAIAELTQNRAAQAPQFDKVLQRKRPLRSGVWLAAAAILIPAAILVVAGLTGSKETPIVEASIDVVAWRAPSDVFLRPASDVWHRGAPQLGDFSLSIYDGTSREETP